MGRHRLCASSWDVAADVDTFRAGHLGEEVNRSESHLLLHGVEG